jgi:polyisoprenoid-binding protein YceI
VKERIVVTSDVFTLTFDTEGGTLIKSSFNKFTASSWSRPTPSSAAPTTVAVKHEVVNTGAAARIAAAVPAAGT